jgi:23S rRNA pseudouridine1911/1915/1917 synthase
MQQAPGDGAKVGRPTALLQVPAAAAGWRLDRFLAEWAQSAAAPEPLRSMSRSHLQQWVLGGHIRLQGQSCRSSARLHLGDRIEILPPAPKPSALLPVALPLEVLFEDAHLIALNKPAGLVVHAGAGVVGPTLVQALLAHCQDLSGIGDALRPGIVHRLDRHTSGVLVAAKHDRAHRGLAEQFAQRLAKKTYLAVAHGRPSPSQGRLDTLFGRHRSRRQCFSSRPELLARTPAPRRAVTLYSLLGTTAELSLLRLRLETGRTHQIRVHLQDIGHPIVGDALYGRAGLSAATPPDVRQAVADLGQHALHAYRLEISHPVDGRRLRLQAPLPMGMLKLATLLRRPAPNPPTAS